MSAALVVGTLQALAVDSQDGSADAGAERLMKRYHEAGRRILQRNRIEHAQHPAERVMPGTAVVKLKDEAWGPRGWGRRATVRTGTTYRCTRNLSEQSGSSAKPATT